MKVGSFICLVAVAVLAVPSFAAVPRLGGTPDTTDVWSETDSYDLDTYMDNPCTAVFDSVWVDYTVDLTKKGQTTSSGERVSFNERTIMSGTFYAASGATISDVTYSERFTIRKYHKVNTSDQFHVVTVIDFDPAKRRTTVSVEKACGDGLPDSAE